MNAETDPWTPLGRLLADYFEGRQDAEAEVIWEDGARSPLPATLFFRRPEEFLETELTALELCRGRVLDAGAGAGRHALVLQERGFEVCALDVCPQAVEIMRRRGVAEARVGDLFTETSGAYDTLLLLMNGIGLVGDLAGLDRFFDHAGRLLAPGGQVLLDSSDLRLTDDVRELERLVTRVRAGNYRGETRQQIEYRGCRGAPLDWLYVDAATLRSRARRHGWLSQVVFEQGGGRYLARLTCT